MAISTKFRFIGGFPQGGLLSSQRFSSYPLQAITKYEKLRHSANLFLHRAKFEGTFEHFRLNNMLK
jgi:hypothetical protein